MADLDTPIDVHYIKDVHERPRKTACGLVVDEGLDWSNRVARVTCLACAKTTSALHYVKREPGDPLPRTTACGQYLDQPGGVAYTGAGMSVTCVPCRETYLYTGPKDLPRWFTAGAKLRVKKTKFLRDVGFAVFGSIQGDQDCKAWPGEIGTVVKREGNGWWDWSLTFDRGREATVYGPTMLENFVREKGAVKADE